MTGAKTKFKKVFKAFLIFFAIVLFGILGVLAYFNAKINYYSKTLKLDEQKLTAAYLKPKILSNGGDDVSSFKFASTVSISEINDYTKNAFISIEDKNFYSHGGVNYERIAKAFLTNVKSGSFKEGASTISQQLIKNAFLSSEKSIDRKLQEIALTKKLEEKYSKDEILEIYLNTIYFGNNIFGIENASKAYFNKSTSQLSLNESAVLAAVIKSPNYFVNENNNKALFDRKNLVLNEMLKDGKITENQFNECINLPTEINSQNSSQTNSVYQNAVIKEACSLLNISEKEFLSSGYVVETYFDNNAQNGLVSALKNENIDYNFGGVIIECETGGIVAFESNLNGFDTLSRQAGSTIKPLLVYAPAIQIGKYLPESFVLDEKIDIGGYSPKNASGNYLGYVPISKAVEKSLNVPAVKVFQDVGVENCKKIASGLGINFSDKENSPALALGSSKNGENLINLTGAYTVLANGGNYQNPHFIKQIEDKNGIILYKFSSSKEKVLSEETCYLTTKMLKNVAKNGTAKSLSNLSFDIASKTGTVGSASSSRNSDAYNISYTTNHAVGIWIGSDDNKESNLMPKEVNGSTLPTKIVKSVLKKMYGKNAPPDFKKPSGIKTVNIDTQEYENNHKIYLADENAPDRLKKTIEVPESFVIEKSPNAVQNENKNLTQSAKVDILARNYIFGYVKK